MHGYVIADVFTDTPLEGNQVAVFLDAAGLDEAQMQRTAREMNLSETVFVLSRAGADAELRIFTPATEMPFAGHPILGTAFVLGSEIDEDVVRLRVPAGDVPVTLTREGDRIVFGRRLSGYELISGLGSRLQSTIAAEDVAGSVVGAVQTGLGASWVRVMLDRPAPRTLAVAGPVRPDESAALFAPLLHDQLQIGGPKIGGRYDQADQQLLETFGRQASLAIRNSQLSTELSHRLLELEASRARLVQAEEAGRRRLERDLHDGAQQELVGLLARLGLVRNQLRRDPQLAESTLREAQLDAQGALERLQELARGIHPAILTDRGLVAAVEERASRLTLPMEVHADALADGKRLPLELEGAGYFFVSEALANVLKHAAATRVDVRFHREAGHLLIEVVDDGRGFPVDSMPLSGLRGIEDRIEALGGRIEVASSPGHGTALRARLPLTGATDG
jgi:signal transduction histidine kinase